MKLQTSAKVLIRRDTDDKYLVLTSSKWEENPLRSQKPDLPGGLVEDGETIEEGLLREIDEEVGLQLQASQLQLCWAMVYQSTNESKSTTFLIFFAEISGDPSITLSWEHESYAWMSAEELFAMEIRKPYPEILQHFKSIGILI